MDTELLSSFASPSHGPLGVCVPLEKTPRRDSPNMSGAPALWQTASVLIASMVQEPRVPGWSVYPNSASPEETGFPTRRLVQSEQVIGCVHERDLLQTKRKTEICVLKGNEKTLHGAYLFILERNHWNINEGCSPQCERKVLPEIGGWVWHYFLVCVTKTYPEIQ